MSPILPPTHILYPSHIGLRSHLDISVFIHSFRVFYIPALCFPQIHLSKILSILQDIFWIRTFTKKIFMIRCQKCSLPHLDFYFFLLVIHFILCYILINCKPNENPSSQSVGTKRSKIYIYVCLFVIQKGLARYILENWMNYKETEQWLSILMPLVKRCVLSPTRLCILQEWLRLQCLF